MIGSEDTLEREFSVLLRVPFGTRPHRTLDFIGLRGV
jgi:hypothetical protein